MTKEYALHLLNQLMIGASVDAKPIIPQYEWAQALDLAIKALEQQPSEDCISRKEIKEFINTMLTSNEEMGSIATNEGRWVEEKIYLHGVEILEGLSEYVNDLPSVTPQRPNGKWIEVLEHRDEFGSTWHYECSECRGMSYKGFEPLEKYCPNCGAEMGGADETN